MSGLFEKFRLGGLFKGKSEPPLAPLPEPLPVALPPEPVIQIPKTAEPGSTILMDRFVTGKLKKLSLDGSEPNPDGPIKSGSEYRTQIISAGIPNLLQLPLGYETHYKGQSLADLVCGAQKNSMVYRPVIANGEIYYTFTRFSMSGEDGFSEQTMMPIGRGLFNCAVIVFKGPWSPLLFPVAAKRLFTRREHCDHGEKDLFETRREDRKAQIGDLGAPRVFDPRIRGIERPPSEELSFEEMIRQTAELEKKIQEIPPGIHHVALDIAKKMQIEKPETSWALPVYINANPEAALETPPFLYARTPENDALINTPDLTMVDDTLLRDPARLKEALIPFDNAGKKPDEYIYYIDSKKILRPVGPAPEPAPEV